jgi:putative DNA primase/helicase
VGDPFARVAEAAAGGAGKPPAGKEAGRDLGQHVAPVPEDAPSLPAEWRELGSPVGAWVYRDPMGRVLRWTLRFVKADGEKDVRPATLWRDKAGKQRWRFAGEPGPRPLYGLDRLTGRPAAPVLLVEGEKTADAAGDRFPEFVALTWPGGSNAVGKADFAALQGRYVIVWPDADDPGRKAAQAVARAATGAGALSATVVSLPAFLPQGWDLADDWPAAFSANDAAALIADARASAQPGGVEWPLSIRMDPKAGLFYDEPRDGSVVPHWLCAPFEVLGEARAPDGLGWAVVVRFRDHDHRERTIPLQRASLASGGGEVRSALADAGLVFDTARGKMDRLTSALMRVKSARRLTLVGATGWCDRRFVLPTRTIGPAGGEPVLFTGEAPSLNYGVAGGIDAWRSEVAAMAEGNSTLLFAISAALAAPMLRVLGAEGGGFHFRGHSSTGKSTLLIAAGSVWGGSHGEQGFGHTWRATANALESLALAHNDALLCLDEFAQVSPAEAGVAAYALANGQGKARLKSDGSLRRRAEWLLLFLSSGEVSLADHMASAVGGGRPAAGQELRLVDVPAEAGAGMGIWETVHGMGDADLEPIAGKCRHSEGLSDDEKKAAGSRLSELVKASARMHYGHAGPAFLERLTATQDEAVTSAREIMAAFMAMGGRQGDSGQVHRVGRRFAVVGAAGELAIAWGIVPWSPGSAAAAALALYRRWAEAFGRDAPREERDVLRRLREVIQSERSAFAPVGDGDMGDEATPSGGGRDGEARQMKTYGFRHVRGAEVRYLFHDAGWQYVFRGFDLGDAARIVSQAGYLEADTDKRRMKKKFKIRGEAQRLYCVKNTILDAALGD